MTTTKTDVLVIGAGPTGLALANLLVRSGVKVRIIDKNAGPTDESRALVVHAKTLELLDRLGLADQAVEDGRRMGAIELMSAGKHVATVSFLDDGADDRTPYPFVLIYEQSQTEHLLLQGLGEAEGRVEWQTEMQGLAQTPDGVQVTVRRPDGEVETIEAGWVVGADGSHSPVRHALALGFEGGTYEQTLYLADVDMEWKLGERQVTVDLTRRGFNGFFPMPGGDRRFRLIGALPPEFAKRDELTIKELQRLLDESSPFHVDILAARKISVYRIHRRMTERFRVGRVFLVGDAAHIHSPAGGQGMNTGIGDAYNLGWKLALVARGDAHELLLDSYEAERMPFARTILNGSDRGFELQVTTSWIGQQLKALSMPLLFGFISHQPTLRKKIFWLISQLWTSYPNSPIVAMSGTVKKGPKAGDRAPYGFFEDGADRGKSLFDTIGDLDHHLLFFAGSKPGSGLANSQEQSLLLGAYGAPIQLHSISAGNRSLHKRYGADEPTIFLIRPDGHIAYRGPAEDLDSLRSYLDKLFSKPGYQKQASTASRREPLAQ